MRNFYNSFTIRSLSLPGPEAKEYVFVSKIPSTRHLGHITFLMKGTN